jgi:hypothetical protein
MSNSARPSLAIMLAVLVYAAGEARAETAPPSSGPVVITATATGAVMIGPDYQATFDAGGFRFEMRSCGHALS